MPRETRQVYSSQGNLVNVAKLYSLATWRRYGERLQFHSAMIKNEEWIHVLSNMKIRPEELEARLKHREIFKEYCRLDKETNKFGIWKTVKR